MRILYHHRTQGEEPESIHIAAIVDALTALGHEVRVVGPAPLKLRPDGGQRLTLAGRIKRLAPRFVFELLQIAYNLVAWLRLRREIRAFRPAMIYERYALFGFAGVLAARQAGVPLILEVNTPYAHAWAEYYGLTLRALARAIERRTLVAAGHVITVTEAQRAMLARYGVPPERIAVCHNAIDPDVFTPQRPGTAALRASLGLHGTVIGFVGTMNRWQGVPGFAEVIEAVVRDAPDAMFLFVGDGEFRASLQERCRAAGLGSRVVFTGRRTHAEVPALMATMDIAILLNSNAYGSPMKIFEYFGMGKAVIAPAVAPVLEVLRDRETGLLVTPGDARQMAERILELVADPALRERLASAGRAYVIDHHTWIANARKVLAIHATLDRGGPASGPAWQQRGA
jgi:glycosyltransferase involved in cell wall biosynthesis